MRLPCIAQAVGRWFQKFPTSTVPFRSLRYQAAKPLCDQTMTSMTF